MALDDDDPLEVYKQDIAACSPVTLRRIRLLHRGYRKNITAVASSRSGRIQELAIGTIHRDTLYRSIGGKSRFHLLTGRTSVVY